MGDHYLFPVQTPSPTLTKQSFCQCLTRTETMVSNQPLQDMHRPKKSDGNSRGISVKEKVRERNRLESPFSAIKCTISRAILEEITVKIELLATLKL